MTVQFYVGHGASGTSASMANHVRGLVARGVDARAIDLPVKQAELAVPVFRRIVPDGPDAPGADGATISVGGQSYGGRVASLAAAEPGTDYAGARPVQLSAPSARLARQGGCPDGPLAGDPLPGAAAVRGD